MEFPRVTVGIALFSNCGLSAELLKAFEREESERKKENRKCFNSRFLYKKNSVREHQEQFVVEFDEVKKPSER